MKAREGYQIEFSDELEALLNDIFEGFIADLQEDPRFVIPVEEFEGAVDENWQYVYTGRGQLLIERMQARLAKIFMHQFPELEFTIESSLYQEL